MRHLKYIPIFILSAPFNMLRERYFRWLSLSKPTQINVIIIRLYFVRSLRHPSLLWAELRERCSCWLSMPELVEVPVEARWLSLSKPGG